MITAMFLALGLQAFAQNGPDGWAQRMRSEKIAYLTAEVGLTPEEAQKFWPIYNQAEQEKHTTMDAVMKAFRELEKAVKAGKDDKELARLVRSYADAVKASNGIDAKYIASYEKVISPAKVAKLFVAEESFRNLQIHRLRGGWNNKPGTQSQEVNQKK